MIRLATRRPSSDATRLAAALLLAAAGLAAAASPSARAEGYPLKPVRIIVPFAPGGGNDFIARFIAQRLSAAVSQQVIVENRPGAGGMMGIEAGVAAPPDGYTLMLISLSYTVNPALYHLKFDPARDITPIIQISTGPLLVVVNPSLPVKSVAELIALARARPRQINYASSGPGSILHLATALFASMAGVQMTHVPYKGGGPAMTDTIAGHTDLLFSSTSAALPFVKEGKLRALAVTSAGRIAAEPDIPTVAESGLPGYRLELWHGLVGPRGLPADIVERLSAEVTRAIAAPEAAALLHADGVSPAGGTPAQFRAKIEENLKLWPAVAREAGVHSE